MNEAIKRLMRLKLLVAGVGAVAVIGVAILGLSVANAFDWSTPNRCLSCHTTIRPGEGTAIMGSVVSDWKMSEHANSLDDPGHDDNDYCARCKSPLEFNPASSYGNRNTVPEDEWQGITCRVCHPPHDTLDYYTGEEIEGVGLFVGGLLVEYVEDPGPSEGPCNDGQDNGGDTVADGDDPDCALDEGAYIDVPEPWERGGEELCTGYCHIPPRHAVDWRGAGKTMRERVDLTCFDCHMPETDDPEACERCHAEAPEVDDPENMWHISHTWEPSTYPEDACLRDGCHPNKKDKWAEKASEKSMHQPPGKVK